MYDHPPLDVWVEARAFPSPRGDRTPVCTASDLKEKKKK